jgi:hypothetical protein
MVWSLCLQNKHLGSDFQRLSNQLHSTSKETFHSSRAIGIRYSGIYKEVIFSGNCRIPSFPFTVGTDKSLISHNISLSDISNLSFDRRIDNTTSVIITIGIVSSILIRTTRVSRTNPQLGKFEAAIHRRHLISGGIVSIGHTYMHAR